MSENLTDSSAPLAISGSQDEFGNIKRDFDVFLCSLACF